MKYIITLIFGILIQVSFAQNKTPEKALDHFKNEFNPIGEYEETWTYENGMHVANYIRNDKKRHAYYSNDGRFLMDKIEVPLERLNSKVQDYINNNLDKSSIVARYEVLSNKAPEHNQILILENGKKYLLTFTPEGEFHFKKELN